MTSRGRSIITRAAANAAKNNTSERVSRVLQCKQTAKEEKTTSVILRRAAHAWGQKQRSSIGLTSRFKTQSQGRKENICGKENISQKSWSVSWSVKSWSVKLPQIFSPFLDSSKSMGVSSSKLSSSDFIYLVLLDFLLIFSFFLFSFIINL